MKIVTIIGARPQFIKSFSITNAICKFNTNNNTEIQEIVIHTGQHYDENMSNIFFKEMKLKKPKYNLKLSKRSHGGMTGQMIIDIEDILIKEKPDYILIYGDTDSTLAGAIAASKLHIPIIHIESGLRSFNRKMPEEINRIIADQLSTFCFCPSKIAVQNLENEGILNSNNKIIQNIGDVMYDVLLHFQKDITPSPNIKNITKNKSFILATLHRAENTDNEYNLKNLLKSFEYISKKTDIILPLHPRTKKQLLKYNIQTHNIKIIDPVSYLDMLYLLKNCDIVLTDSGGLQKEAYFSKKYCITLRNETEWVELVEKKVNIITGPNYKAIKKAFENIPSDLNFSVPLYGNGYAGEKIIDILIKYNKINNI